MEKIPNNRATKITGVVVAIILALLAILTFASTQIGSVDERLTASIAEVTRVERSHYEQVMDRLMKQGQIIGEIRGILGRIEDKIDDKE